MRKSIVAVAATCLLALPVVPAGAAKSHLQELGTDPAGDGAPALDVTYLQVGRIGSDFEIRIGIDKMLPGTGGYPEAPGIEWVFDVKGRRFIAEAVAGAQPRFFLFEEKDGGYQQLENPTGTYDFADGYASIIVPLKAIGAKPGVRIAGAKGLPHGDVDAHVHLFATDYYPDGMQTKKDYVVP